MTPNQKFAAFMTGLLCGAILSGVAEFIALYTLMLADNPSEEAEKAAWAIFPAVGTGWLGLLGGWRLG